MRLRRILTTLVATGALAAGGAAIGSAATGSSSATVSSNGARSAMPVVPAVGSVVNAPSRQEVVSSAKSSTASHHCPGMGSSSSSGSAGGSGSSYSPSGTVSGV